MNSESSCHMNFVWFFRRELYKNAGYLVSRVSPVLPESSVANQGDSKCRVKLGSKKGTLAEILSYCHSQIMKNAFNAEM